MEGFQSSAAKILRAPSLKRGKPDERISDRIKLERVLGVTVSSNAALDSDPISETVAYPAGCTVVLFNTQSGQQSHIINTSRKSITSLAFSSCGRYLVTGECGHQPAVRVWDLQSDPQSGHPGLYPQVQQVAEFLSHKYGVSCVAFSPSNKYVVSIGTQHDMIVNVWDWKSNIKAASNKVSTKVKALAFSENGSYFVTVGNRHVKFWFLEYGRTKYKEAVPLMGRSAILGEQRNNYFCDVACGKAQCGDSTYAITRSGLLCEFNNRRLLDKWVELRTTSANCLAVGEQLIFVGCAEGIVRCFDPLTLRFITTLPRTHYLGVDVSKGLHISHMSSTPSEARYPDTIAAAYDESSNKLTCIYNDHSVYVWDVHDIKRVGKSHSSLYHSACIWGVEMAPPNSPLPPGSFLTCSSDDTIRVWHLEKLTEKSSRGMYKRNIYSKELLKVVYVDEDLTYLKDLDLSGTNVNNEKQESSSYDGRNGVRCIRLSPNGNQLASGDRAGNIRIHDTTTMKRLVKIEAHDAEVLCLEYSNLDTGVKLMASASRDRLIHVFDVNNGYNFLQTLDDHSSSITAVRMLNTSHGNLQMVSCGADKSLIFRSLGGSPNGTPQFVRGHNATGKTTLYDMEVDAGQKHILTACQDRNVRIYSVNTGKHTKSFKGSTGDDGTLIKVVLDRSGIYLASSCTDKSLSVYDYYTGECMATMCGHSELATGLRFTNDCRRLISASGDGCIFVWRVPHDMVVTMHARLSQQAMRQGKTLDSEIFAEDSNVEAYEGKTSAVEHDYRFNIGQLPLWAKKHISEDTSPPISLSKGVAAPKGRWAQRAERSVGVKSFYADSVISFPSLQERRIDSDGSKESSLDSGTESRMYSSAGRGKQDDEFAASPESYDEITKSPSHHHQMSSSKITVNRGDVKRSHLTDDSALGSLRDPDESTAHDGDIDSDHEYRHQPLYYPNQVDSASGSEFTVTNFDADELRRSVRKSKRANLPPITIQPTSISGSQDSDDDDDEASTPSGENTDRNPMSILSISSESLDQLANREKYLQSTFESLSGAELDSPGNKSSISAQFHTRTNGGTPTLRNMAVINAAKQTKNDPDAVRKREQLNQMIADTRKKLANVGYSSPLKYSKSIHDLSYIPEKDKWGTSPNNRKQGLKLSDMLNKSPEKSQKELAALIRPRKLKLDKTLAKYKMHKSLPVSPVSEECRFSDFAEAKTELASPPTKDTRRSFSYFIDLNKEIETERGLKQICDDIAKFTRNYEEIEGVDEDTNFSSDSLEDCSFSSSKDKRNPMPRRCVSNNEIYKYQSEERDYSSFYHAYDCAGKTESFYLNQSNKNSQESILSDDCDSQHTKSYCNSLESILSNESECKSAPLEILFTSHRQRLLTDNYGGSLPKHYEDYTPSKPSECYLRPPYNEIRRSHTFTASESTPKSNMRTSQTQTELNFNTPEEIVAKKTNFSAEFQRKLLKFETCIAQNEVKPRPKATPGRRGIAFFVEADLKPPAQKQAMKEKNDDVSRSNRNNCAMYIPTLETKNRQYKSKFCNVLNNKPELNIEIYESGGNANANKIKNSFTLTNLNFERPNKNQIQETSSLDRHLLSKGLLDSEKICHKPPKAVRRHSSKTRKNRTSYEYIKKDDFFKYNNKKSCVLLNNCGNENLAPTLEKTIEFHYKEKNTEKECENGNIFTELYDSLDKPTLNTKIECDSLEVNINNEDKDKDLKMYDSLEVDLKNVWTKDPQHDEFNIWKGVKDIDKLKPSAMDRIQFALENIKILNEIQRKIHKINNLVDIFKQNMCVGKVRALSSMYESLTNSKSYYNDLSGQQAQATSKFRKRNLSLPNFVERRLNFEAEEHRSKSAKSKAKQANNESCLRVSKNERVDGVGALQVHLGSETPESSLRRACSLSDLSMQTPVAQPKRKQQPEQVSGKVGKGGGGGAPSTRSNLRYAKNLSMTRSSSTGVLNQSDSDTESNEKKTQSRLMRPTISSLNKLANVKNTNMRKRHSHSVMNLSSVGQDDSSSEDGDKVLPTKPAVPPRTRSLNSDSQQLSARKVTNKEKPKATTRSSMTYERKKSVEDLDCTLTHNCNVEDLDVSTVQLSTQLCDEVALQLTRAASNVVELYRRLTDVNLKSSDQAGNVQKTDMVKNLELSMARTQKLLQECTPATSKQNNGNIDVNQTDTVKKLNDLVSKGFANDQNTVVNVMEQYSDILLGLMQQKIQNTNT